MVPVSQSGVVVVVVVVVVDGGGGGGVVSEVSPAPRPRELPRLGPQSMLFFFLSLVFPECWQLFTCDSKNVRPVFVVPTFSTLQPQ